MPYLVLALDTLLNDEVIPLYNDEIIKEYNDVVFYEVALSQEDSFLVTENTKHFLGIPEKKLGRFRRMGSYHDIERTA